MTLRNLFRQFNRKYFGNRLSVSDVRFGKTGTAYAETTFLDDCDPIITLQHELGSKGRFCRMALLHEMAHVELGADAGHGPKFVKRMRKLVRQGAYDGLI